MSSLVVPCAFESWKVADTVGAKVNDYYSLTKYNDPGWPEGSVFQLTPEVTYTSDAAAVSGGVQDGELFAVAVANVWGVTRHAVKVLNPSATYRNDSDAAENGGILLGRPYAVANFNDYGMRKNFVKLRIS